MRWSAWLLQYAGHIRHRGGGSRRASLQRAHAKGLVSVDLRRVRKLRWELRTESHYARPPVQRRWYDVQYFGTVNIGGTIIIDATGGVGTYTVNRTARARCQSPTAQLLIYMSGRVHRSIGWPGTPGGLGTGTATREPSRNCAPAFVARLDLPIIRFGAFNPHQTLLPTN